MEEAATPLPSEETTPPVTNIYFGAIRIARAVTRSTAPDFSYLSGKPITAGHRIAYKQLWLCPALLSIPTICASVCKFFLAAQRFHALRV